MTPESRGWALGGGRRQPSSGGAVTLASPAPGAIPGRSFRFPGLPALTSAERRAVCARARERKNGSAQTLRPGRGAGRGEGGAAGAERAERAPGCLRAAFERARPAAGLGSRAVSALGRRKCAFAAREGRRDAGVAAGRGERGSQRRRERGASGCIVHSGAVSLGVLGGREGCPRAGSGGGRWTAGERIGAPLPRTSSRARQEAGRDPRFGAIGCLHRSDRTPRLPL